MIGAIAIQGFQAHKSIRVDLDAGVTTIIGPSDAGKSAILRALRWLALNEPAGDLFIRWGEKKAVVEIGVDQHHDIRRTRGGAENSYELGDREFKAFGAEVPKEVSDVLGMNEIHFQGQYDGPFWLSDTAGEVSRHLNRIVGLEVIDTVLSKLGALIRRRGTEVELIEERVASAKTERRRWKFVEALNEDLTALEGSEVLLDEMRDSVSQLLEECEGHDEGALNLHRANLLIAAGGELINAGEASVKEAARCSDLAGLIRDAETKQSIALLGCHIPDLVGIAELEKGIDSIRELESLVESACRVVSEREEAKAEVVTLSSCLREQMGEVCGLCGQTISL